MFCSASQDLALPSKSYLKSQPALNGGAPLYGSPNVLPDHITNGNGTVTAGELPAALHRAADAITSASQGHDSGRQGRSRDITNSSAAERIESYEIPRNGVGNESNKRPAVLEVYGANSDDVSSKWIHRDKLARIESEELQAAGIIFPKSRARSKPRRDVSVDKTSAFRRAGTDNDLPAESRSRKNSTILSDHKIADMPVPGWDLRLPEEIAEESYFATPNASRGSSRIPVAKTSPAPIALEYMERDMPITRQRGDSLGIENSIAYPRTRSASASKRPSDGGLGSGAVPTSPLLASPPQNATRSVSDVSPKKTPGAVGSVANTATSGGRKTSAPTKMNLSAGRPKTRNGTSKDSNSSGTGATRPSTRSGERELSREVSAGAASKQPEGEPPWMISAYRPDPRLPPDQQLLPTVARRLQQEKWEREGKFGSVYDREFRPLNDEGLASPPEALEKPTREATGSTAESEKQDEWPLKPQTRSPTIQQGRLGSYSTIPKIQDKPNMSPLPSPRQPMATVPEPGSIAQAVSPRRDEEDGAKQGCGCCNVM